MREEAMRPAAKERVRSVPPIELADGHEIDGRGQQTKPGGEPDRADVEHLIVASLRPEQVAHQAEENGFPKRQASSVFHEGTESRLRDANEERGYGNDESRERAREADVDERASMRKRRADHNEGAQGSDQREWEGDKERQRRLHVIITGGEVMTHFMGQQDRHDGEAERSSVGDDQLELLAHRHDVGEELLRLGGGERQTLVGPDEKRRSDGQQKEDDVDEWKLGFRLGELLRVGRPRELDADRGSRSCDGFLGRVPAQWLKRTTALLVPCISSTSHNSRALLRAGFVAPPRNIQI